MRIFWNIIPIQIASVACISAAFMIVGLTLATCAYMAKS